MADDSISKRLAEQEAQRQADGSSLGFEGMLKKISADVTAEAASKLPVPKLSDGSDATLGNYLLIAEAMEFHRAADFLRHKIGQSPNGANEAVLAAESQMMMLLGHLR